MTAEKGTWNPADASLAVEWLRDDVPIAGQTGDTYTLVAADLTHTIKIRVTASKVNFDKIGRASWRERGEINAAVVNIETKTVTGLAQVGPVINPTVVNMVAPTVTGLA